MLICCQEPSSCFSPKICQLFPVPVQIPGPGAVLLWTRAAATQANKPIKTTPRAVSVEEASKMPAAFFVVRAWCRQQTRRPTQREASLRRPPTAAPRAAPTARKTIKPQAVLPIPFQLACLGTSQITSKGESVISPDFCGAVGAAEARKTAASGRSSYIWPLTTRLSLMTDSVFFLTFLTNVTTLPLFRALPTLFFLLLYPLTVLCVQRGESGLSGKAPAVRSSRRSRAAGVTRRRFPHSLKDRQQVRNYCRWFDCFSLEKRTRLTPLSTSHRPGRCEGESNLIRSLFVWPEKLLQMLF